MDSRDFNLRIDAGFEIEKLLVSSGLLMRAWNASESAYKADSASASDAPESASGRCKHFFYEQDENVMVIAFPGTQCFEDARVDAKFRECEISSSELFSSLKVLKDRDEKSALVHRGFLERFRTILEDAELKNKVKVARETEKGVVFTGHSLGGAVATLATLWKLDEGEPQDSFFCLTFGSPLVGDVTLAELVRRRGWASRFCHVVSRHDIVPRILLAPFDSISMALGALIPFWWKRMTAKTLVPETSHSNIRRMWKDFWGNLDKTSEEPIPLPTDARWSLLNTVLHHGAAVARYASSAIMGTPNIVITGLEKTIIQSPYRPFGSYVFCSRTGAACIENSEAVLQMLYFTLKASDNTTNIATACIDEHTRYGTAMLNVIQNLGHVGGLARLSLSDAKSPHDVAISMQLEALGLGIQDVYARFALQIASEVKNNLMNNSFKKAAELAEMQSDAMTEIEWYKNHHDNDNLGYFDRFKQYNDSRDKEANKNRLKLAAFWDVVTEMVVKNHLPDGFQSQNKWVNAGTAYRLLVEPLDIANFYRLGKHEDSGGYILNGRPRRYKVLEIWQREKDRTRQRRRRTSPASLTHSSLFWANLEECAHSLNQWKDNPSARNKKFETDLVQELDSFNISPEIFLKESSFIKWLKGYKKTLTDQEISESPLYGFMQSKNYETYTSTLNRENVFDPLELFNPRDVKAT